MNPKMVKATSIVLAVAMVVSLLYSAIAILS